MSKSEQQSIEQRRRYGVRVKVCLKDLDTERRIIDDLIQADLALAINTDQAWMRSVP